MDPAITSNTTQIPRSLLTHTHSLSLSHALTLACLLTQQKNVEEKHGRCEDVSVECICCYQPPQLEVKVFLVLLVDVLLALLFMLFWFLPSLHPLTLDEVKVWWFVVVLMIWFNSLIVVLIVVRWCMLVRYLRSSHLAHGRCCVRVCPRLRSSTTPLPYALLSARSFGVNLSHSPSRSHR